MLPDGDKPQLEDWAKVAAGKSAARLVMTVENDFILEAANEVVVDAQSDRASKKKRKALKEKAPRKSPC